MFLTFNYVPCFIVLARLSSKIWEDNDSEIYSSLILNLKDDAVRD